MVSNETVRREAIPLTLPRLLDLGERAILAAALVGSVYLNLHAWDAASVMLVANNALTTLFVLFRRRAAAVSTVPTDWFVAVVGTTGAMLMRPGGGAVLPETAAAVVSLVGFVVQLVAKLSLNRRFGIGPANRGIQDRWAYGLVRHPMYLGYLLIQGAYLLRNLAPLNLAIFAVTWACQIARIKREERFLSMDPSYRSYAERVRFRLIPMLF